MSPVRADGFRPFFVGREGRGYGERRDVSLYVVREAGTPGAASPTDLSALAFGRAAPALNLLGFHYCFIGKIVV